MNASKIDWRQVSRGLYLVGFGSILALNTLGTLPWAIWGAAASFWPVALVALGIRLIFERSRWPWAILLSPVVVFSTLAFVAARTPDPPGRDWAPVAAARPAGVRRWSFSGDLALGSLRLAARPLPLGVLLEGRAADPGGSRVKVDREDDSAVVSVGRHRLRGPIVLGFDAGSSWDLGLAADLPMNVDLNLAFASGEVDLSAAPLSRLEIDGAFNGLDVRLGAPVEDVRLGFHGAFNAIQIEVPATVPVTVRTDGFLNLVDGRSGAGKLAGPGYNLRLEGAFNRVKIHSP